ncbi:haloacid dehalogenase type II [Cryobacterium sp. SO1]|uniref:haloacid dehalogenase type II n=1 Tax=Cryobacterium sp. SO1 TaxID=1897061 RepID=UPI0010DDD482|nr:haloacid dehalogenase type II [Cryobacterium sp. SO1]RZI36695.1 Haloacetate dehalogenase H-2 [Cryobacterium sp. SO1]
MPNTTPAVIVFDVNETLSDLSGLKARFVQVGAPAHLATAWFAAVLRDGFALAVAGGAAPFAVIGSELLREVLRDIPLQRSTTEAVEHIMAGFGLLALHPDVPEGVRALTGTGMRLVTLSNGSAEVARSLLAAAELESHFEALLSVEEAGAWKPMRAAYDYAAEACGVRPAELLLVAVHPWDIHGAAEAGLATAWLNRGGDTYPSYFTAPDYTVTRLAELATVLADAPDAVAAWDTTTDAHADSTPDDPADGLVVVTESGTGGYAQQITVGPHRLTADEPRPIGTDTGPSPYDLVLAGLGACTSMTVRMYAERKKWPLEKVTVTLRHHRVHAKDCADCETVVGQIDHIERVLRFEGDLDEEQRRRLAEIADKCPVHRTLHSEIVVHTTVQDAAPARP